MDKGLEDAGMECAWQIENDEYCNRVLEKHWPRVRRYGDIQKIDPATLENVDLVCGGFPCQDVSFAGIDKRSRKLLEGGKSSLLYDFARIVRHLRPDWVIIENVLGVRSIYKTIIEEFKDYKLYDAEITASAAGAYTRRKRIFIVGYSRSGSISSIFRFPQFGGFSYQTRGHKDTLPMCLPWKGGLNLERLGSTVIQHKKTYAGRVRAGNGIPNRMDRIRWQMIGNAVSPPVMEAIGRQIINANTG